MDESKNLSKVYDPKQVEEHWYSVWEQNKYFAGKMEEGKQSFSIVKNASTQKAEAGAIL